MQEVGRAANAFRYSLPCNGLVFCSLGISRSTLRCRCSYNDMSDYNCTVSVRDELFPKAKN